MQDILLNCILAYDSFLIDNVLWVLPDLDLSDLFKVYLLYLNDLNIAFILVLNKCFVATGVIRIAMHSCSQVSAPRQRFIVLPMLI